MFIISNSNPAMCASLGDNVGKFAQAVFAPKNKLNDPSQDQLMIYPSGQLSASQWVSNNNGGLLHNAKSVTRFSIDQGGSNTSTIPGTFTVVEPAKAPTVVGGSTVTVSFTITDTSNTSACTFTATGNLAGPF